MTHLEPRPWHQASGTAHSVAMEVLLHGPIARSEIARRLNLSGATLTRLTKPLLDSDLIVEGEAQIDPQSGRLTRPLDMVATGRHFIGVRLTEWEAQGVLTTIRSEIIDHHVVRFDTTDRNSVVAAVLAVIERLRIGAAVAGVGISIGGTVTDRRVVDRAPFFGWSEPVHLATIVSEACGLAVLVENDLIALTRGQLWFGAGLTAESFAIVTVGIATGLGLVINGRVVENSSVGGGPIGHLPLNPFGPVCPDGHRGCAQAMLSIGSISAAASVAMGRELTYAETLAAARAGSPAAQRVVEDSVKALGLLIGTVASCTLTDLVLIAGEGAGLVEGHEAVLRQGLDEARPGGSGLVETRIESQSSEPWCRGAATLAVETYLLGSS